MPWRPCRTRPDHADRSPAGLDLFRPDLPFALQVELTSRCNLKCRMCPLTTATTASSASPGAMSEVVLDELLAIARRCRLVAIAGYGEPLADRRCLPLLHALDEAGIEMHLATNGLTLTPALCRELADIASLTHVNVSIESPDPECYREIRGADVRRALAGVGHLTAAVSDPGRVAVSSVVLRRNLPTLVGFPAVLAPLGVRHYRLQGVMDYNAWAAGQSLLDHLDAAPIVAQIEAACRSFGIHFELATEERLRADVEDPDHARVRFYGRGGWDERRTRECTVPWEVPYIDKDGRVYACCFAGSADADPFGQLGPQTFDDVWHGEPAQRFRRQLLDGATTPAICRRCTVTPLGPHPFVAWRARVETVEVTHGERASVRVLVRNEGTRTWTPRDHVRVGTYAPRDGTSALEHPTWMGSTRAATFRDDRVEPGATASFAFAVTAPVGGSATGSFQLVVEGVRWLPNTQFTVAVGGPRPPRGARLRAALARRAGPRARALVRRLV